VKSVIVGTAGHIDHGKTALVRALTGIDTDRLEEEKRRGITIDIGFAHLELAGPGGEPLRLGFVDVPGHERFVRNMLAGVGGIDLALLVVGADEGVKPQTREHFDICRLLAIRRGLTVLTKADLVDADTLAVVRLELEDYLRGSFLDPAQAPIVAVSAKTGAGLEELRRELARVAAEVPAKDSTALLRLPIDRVFTMKGFGTVVTGTLIGGAVRKEEELEVLPGGRRVRVRGVQVHGQPAEQAIAGERTALNLAGVATEDLARGLTLAPPATLRATQRVDVSLMLLPGTRPLKNRSRVHLHAYTAETIAEVVLYGASQIEPGQAAYAQLRLAAPLLLLPGDRFILRQFSPVVTIGGGTVVEALAERVPAKSQAAHAEWLAKVATSAPADALCARMVARQTQGFAVDEAVARTGMARARIEALAATLPEIARIGDVLILKESLRALGEAVAAALGEFHARNPLAAGISKEELRNRFADVQPEVFAMVLASLARENKIELSGETVKLAGRGVVMKDEEAEAKRTIEQAFAMAGLKVPALKEVLAALPVDRARAQKIVTLLLRERVLVKLADELVFHREALEELRRSLLAYKAKSPKIGVAQFKELTGVSRKYAIPLLEYLDRERVTRRVGDERVIL
jgi:selenocysteine-specific elongation factor